MAEMLRFFVLFAAGIASLLIAGLQSHAQVSAQPAPVPEHSAAPQAWRIAFDRSAYAYVTDGGSTHTNIFVVNAENNPNEVKLTTDNLSTDPVWSPDGRRIAFVREGYFGGIFVMDADGTNARRIAETYYPQAITLAWSPNGKSLAFDEVPPDYPNRLLGAYNRSIYIVNLDTALVPRRLVKNGARPSWSPDGTQIAYTCDGATAPNNRKLSVCAISLNADSVPRVIADNALNPLWSPDGQQFLYISTAEAKPELFVMQIDGSNPRRISDKRHDVISALWSPNGKHIAFTSNRVMDTGFSTTAHFEGSDSGMFQGESSGTDPAITETIHRYSAPLSQKLPELFVASADGSGIVQIAPKQNVWCHQFSWSPDSSSIAGICGSGLANSSGDHRRLATDSIFVMSVSNPHSKPRVIAHSGIERISPAPSAPTK
jgi:Tol biopolymer transport system component